MSEENKAVEAENQQTQEEPKAEVEKAKEVLFNQEQLNNIVQQRLDAEKKKAARQMEEIKKKEEEALREKQIQEAKTKADLEKLMQEKIAQKDQEIQRMKNEISKERIDNQILSVASSYKAVSPQQVVSLLKDQVKLTDDNQVQILDNNSNIRYNEKGQHFTIEETVKEFLDANPHFRQGSKAGTGSTSSIEGKTVKPFNIQDLDMSKPEDRKIYDEYRKKRDQGAIEINLNK